MIKGKEEFICVVCGESFLSEESLMKHFKQKHLKKQIVDMEQLTIEELLKSNFKNYTICIVDGTKKKCSYLITLIDTERDIQIQQKYGENLDDSYMYQNPKTEGNLIQALKEKIKTFDIVEEKLSENEFLEYVVGTKFCYGENEDSDGYHFEIKIKGINKIIEETYLHNEIELNDFIEKCNDCFVTKLEGEVSTSNEWGIEYYINKVNIEKILMMAQDSGKKVRLEII